mmetsp:Transcript_128760/g.191912  ORF Transcript_128760/g.191912 Transcript_128760/m.191912 type:complete len:266 (+) Transcript_128760:547-1344(+)
MELALRTIKARLHHLAHLLLFLLGIDGTVTVLVPFVLLLLHLSKDLRPLTSIFLGLAHDTLCQGSILLAKPRGLVSLVPGPERTPPHARVQSDVLASHRAQLDGRTACVMRVFCEMDSLALSLLTHVDELVRLVPSSESGLSEVLCVVSVVLDLAVQAPRSLEVLANRGVNHAFDHLGALGVVLLVLVLLLHLCKALCKLLLKVSGIVLGIRGVFTGLLGCLLLLLGLLKGLAGRIHGLIRGVLLLFHGLSLALCLHGNSTKVLN